MIWRNQIIDIGTKIVEICLENKVGLYPFVSKKLTYLPREKVGFVSTFMIWTNQIVAICMKIVEIFREKWLVFINIYDFGGIKLFPFV